MLLGVLMLTVCVMTSSRPDIAFAESGEPVVKLHHRSKRATYANRLTNAEKNRVLNKHNELRALEEASNMKKLIWNDELASMAQEWADKCVFEHGHPARTDPKYADPGQNLFKSSGMGLADVGSPVQTWYNEIDYYTYDTHTCQTGKMCGHYTQLVWAKSFELGCAYNSCSGWGTVLVCNYGPSGNAKGTRPYLIGKTCSRCNNGKSWCDPAGFCNDACTRANKNCVCRIACGNCGVGLSDCSCDCTNPMFWGSFCENDCLDTDSRCGGVWIKGLCGYPFVASGCPAMCGKCTLFDGNRPKCRPPKTTTTTSKPTTTTTMDIDPCRRWTCSNGGSKRERNMKCECVCTKHWQGDTCKESRQEAVYGVILTFGAPLSKWDQIWERSLPRFVDRVNKRCNRQVASCCKGTTMTTSGGAYTFVTADSIFVGQGYPYEYEANGNPRIRSLFYARVARNSELCKHAKKNSRRKRDIAPEDMLSQDILVEIVQEMEADLGELLEDCCNVTYLGVHEATREPPPSEEQPHQTWAIVTIAVLGFLLIMAGFFLVAKVRVGRIERPHPHSHHHPYSRRQAHRNQPNKPSLYTHSMPPSYVTYDNRGLTYVQ